MREARRQRAIIILFTYYIVQCKCANLHTLVDFLFIDEDPPSIILIRTFFQVMMRDITDDHIFDNYTPFF
jgi:hypothetical protein